VIRSTAGDLLGGTVTANGGSGGVGGAAAVGSPGGTGGNGSPGRVRADVAIHVPTIAGDTSGTLHRNPTFDPTTPPYVITSKTSLLLHGTQGDVIDITDYDVNGVVQGTEPSQQMFGPAGTAMVSGITLQAGYNKICATLEDGVPGTALADTCTVVMYLP